MFLVEARKYNVLPLDDRFAERADAALRPNLLAGKTSFVYLPGTVRIPEPAAPNTKNVDHTIGVELDIPDVGADGALVSCGGEAGGYTLFIHGGHLVWEHNWFNEERYRVTSDAPIPPGASHRIGRDPGGRRDHTRNGRRRHIATGRNSHRYRAFRQAGAIPLHRQ